MKITNCGYFRYSKLPTHLCFNPFQKTQKQPGETDQGKQYLVVWFSFILIVLTPSTVFFFLKSPLASLRVKEKMMWVYIYNL